MLLDLDDTIVAFDAIADDCWRTLCTRFSLETPSVSGDALFMAIGRSREWFWSDPKRHQSGRRDLQAARRQVVARAFSELQLEASSVASRLADAYTEERERLVQPFPGAIEAVQELTQSGVTLALVTNGEDRFQRSKIERFDLARHFACIVIEGEFGVGKPDPAIFTHALNAIGHQPEDAWMVGDSLTFDIAPALNLGMHTAWIDRTGTGLPEGTPYEPTLIVNSLSALRQK